MRPGNLVYGLHPVTALLERQASVRQLWVQDSRNDERLETVLKLAGEQGVRIQRVPRRELDELAGGGRHQGVIAEAEAAAARDENDLQSLINTLSGPAFLLVLDSIQDPHNLGACLRSAEAAGVHAVIAPKDRAAELTPAARKAAAGAAERLAFIQVTNLARTLRWLKQRNIWLVGLAGEADDELYSLDLKGPLALVLGAEGSGLRRLSKTECDFLVRIPMAGGAESLNVSVAAGVALFEAVRQRRTISK